MHIHGSTTPILAFFCRLLAVLTCTSVTEAIADLRVKSCLINGEIVVCDAKGLAVLDLLRHGNRVKRAAHLFAFDLLELDGLDLTPRPIEERKGQLVRRAAAGLQLCDHFKEVRAMSYSLTPAHSAVRALCVERRGSPYRPGPAKCPDWIKVKNPASSAVKREAEEDWSKRGWPKLR
jgi:bifunctional non-homologous end joining protein LigD